MQRSFPVSMSAVLLATTLAGCAVGGGDLAADFTWTSDDNQTFDFDAGASGGKPATYLWEFGDGSTGEGAKVQHRYDFINGDYDVTLTVADAGGATKAVTKAVTTGDRPNEAPVLMVMADKRWVRPDEAVLFDARATHDADGDPFVLRWDFNYDIQPFEMDQWTNLGLTSYQGNVEHAPADGNESNESGTRALDPPAAQELEDAWQRYEERLLRQHGAHGGDQAVYKPSHVAEFDGQINDTSPMQFFSWPAAGDYYVRVEAMDIKGDATPGFMAVRVSSNAPNQTQESSYPHTIECACPPTAEEGPPPNWVRQQVPMRYAGSIDMFVTVGENPTGSTFRVYVCKNTITDRAKCYQSPLATAGPAANNLFTNLTVSEQDDFLAYNVYVAADANSSPGAQVPITIRVVQKFDTNPWYNHEAGVGGADH